LTEDPLVICSFKDRKSRRDIADSLVQEFPERFPNRSAVYLKAFNLLVESQELELNLRKTAVDGHLQQREDEAAIAELFGNRKGKI
jgi:hypothetical protein